MSVTISAEDIYYAWIPKLTPNLPLYTISNNGIAIKEINDSNRENVPNYDKDSKWFICRETTDDENKSSKIIYIFGVKDKDDEFDLRSMSIYDYSEKLILTSKLKLDKSTGLLKISLIENHISDIIKNKIEGKKIKEKSDINYDEKSYLENSLQEGYNTVKEIYHHHTHHPTGKTAPDYLLSLVSEFGE